MKVTPSTSSYLTPHRQQQWECSLIFEKAKKSCRDEIAETDCIANFEGRASNFSLYGLILRFEVRDAACVSRIEQRKSRMRALRIDNRKTNYGEPAYKHLVSRSRDECNYIDR